MTEYLLPLSQGCGVPAVLGAHWCTALTTYESVIDRLDFPAGSHIDLWLFASLPHRQALQEMLQQQGISARVRCAYKPLLHAFLEDIEIPPDVIHVEVCYPIIAGHEPRRFLLESYPLPLHFESIKWTFEPAGQAMAEPTPAAQPVYHVTLISQTGEKHHLTILAPNLCETDFLGERVCAPVAWLQSSTPQLAQQLDCPYREAYRKVIDFVRQQEWGKTEPYFGTLQIEMVLPGPERLPQWPSGEDHVSTTEAMHEEIYFSLLEFFQRHSGRPAGDRRLQPGRILPLIRQSDTELPFVNIRCFALQEQDQAQEELLRFCASSSDLDVHGWRSPMCSLGSMPALQTPLEYSATQQLLCQWPGVQLLSARSGLGCHFSGFHRSGSHPAVLISGAQHGNETSGVIGALRAADNLLRDPAAHLALIPVENPDGYRLHESMCRVHPGHMVHAARYSALGDDIEYRKGPGERDLRAKLLALTGAQLHLNLHGYPAHEWTRPLTGYVPRGFSLWSVPKGFFLIVRHRKGWQTAAVELLDAVCQQLSGFSPLMEFNQRQLKLYQQHTLDDVRPGFEVRYGIPCMLSEDSRSEVGVTLITEFPDETLFGPAFRLAHECQTQAILAACQIWWGSRIQQCWPQ